MGGFLINQYKIQALRQITPERKDINDISLEPHRINETVH